MKRINIEDHLIGRFYFKQTHNGNLIGEFSNNRTNIISTESADTLTTTQHANFIGEYNGTWQQDSTPFFCKLKIQFKPNTFDKIYSLTWTDLDGNLKFIGEGFVFENSLIGDYRDFEI